MGIKKREKLKQRKFFGENKIITTTEDVNNDNNNNNNDNKSGGVGTAVYSVRTGGITYRKKDFFGFGHDSGTAVYGV